MGVRAAYVLSFAGIFGAALGAAFFGALGLIIGIILIGLAVLEVAVVVDARTTPRVTEPARPPR